MKFRWKYSDTSCDVIVINRPRNRPILFLGKPGVGKTTFLNNLLNKTTYSNRSNEVKQQTRSISIGVRAMNQQNNKRNAQKMSNNVIYQVSVTQPEKNLTPINEYAKPFSPTPKGRSCLSTCQRCSSSNEITKVTFILHEPTKDFMTKVTCAMDQIVDQQSTHLSSIPDQKKGKKKDDKRKECSLSPPLVSYST